MHLEIALYRQGKFQISQLEVLFRISVYDTYPKRGF